MSAAISATTCDSSAVLGYDGVEVHPFRSRRPAHDRMPPEWPGQRSQPSADGTMNGAGNRNGLLDIQRRLDLEAQPEEGTKARLVVCARELSVDLLERHAEVPAYEALVDAVDDKRPGRLQEPVHLRERAVGIVEIEERSQANDDIELPVGKRAGQEIALDKTHPRIVALRRRRDVPIERHDGRGTGRKQ